MEPTSPASPSTAAFYPWSPPAGGPALATTMLVAGGFTLIMFVAMLVVAGTGTTMPVPAPALLAIGAAVVMLGALVVAATQRFVEISPWVRSTVVLAVLHAAIAVAALALWMLSAERTALFREDYPVHTRLPVPAIAFGLSVAVLVVAGLRAPRRAGTMRWLQAVSAWALTFLLGLALWLPVYAEYGGEPVEALRRGAAVDWLLIGVLVPPALAATIAAVIVGRRPRWRATAAIAGLGLAAVMLLVALIARADLSEGERALYGNFVPTLFGAAWFAMATIAALAVTHLRTLRLATRDRRRPAPWRQEGIVAIKAPSSTTVAQLVNGGWLAGMEATTRAFTLRTRHGDLPIPAGAAVIAPLPAWTAQAPAGSAVPVISEGDRVVVSGFVVATGVEPYRTSPRPTPGTAGLVITTTRRLDEPVARDLLLRVWRPCAAFLIVVTIAGLPGLLGLMVD